MSFTKERREQIIYYLLEKIDSQDPDAVKKTTDIFQVTAQSVYRYLASLVKDGILNKDGRKYSLAEDWYFFSVTLADLNTIGEDGFFRDLIAPKIRQLPRNVFGIWNYACTEMVNNVIDHSEAGEISVSICRNYLNTQIVLSDDGVGIFHKIQTFFGFPSMDDAIAELFKGKLTTDSSAHTGEGIFFTSRILDRFAVVSDGKVFSHDKYIESLKNIPDSVSAKMFNKGTTIYMELSNRSHKHLEDVFDEYADVDGGFRKTRIPLKNIYETYPVSRSQAKRLVFRFENFNEIILDFDEIPSLGQGFAHELFVVFQNNHPDIKLTPVNENDSVKKMINHVLNS